MMPACRKSYYMVLGKNRPTVQHATFARALSEAERLARQNRGQEFVVLGAVAVVESSDVSVVYLEHEADDDHPF